MLPEDVAAFLTRPNGEFVFQRWATPIVPQIFGPAAPDPELILTAMDHVSSLTGHKVVRSPDGTSMNCTIWFVREWTDLMTMPGTEALLGSLGAVAKELAARNSNLQVSSTDDPETGGIGQLVLTLRMNGPLGGVSPEDTALRVAMLTHLRWPISKQFPGVISRDDSGFRINPKALAVLRAAYDPSLPNRSDDPALAARIAALIPASAQP